MEVSRYSGIFKLVEEVAAQERPFLKAAKEILAAPGYAPGQHPWINQANQQRQQVTPAPMVQPQNTGTANTGGQPVQGQPPAQQPPAQQQQQQHSAVGAAQGGVSLGGNQPPTQQPAQQPQDSNTGGTSRGGIPSNVKMTYEDWLREKDRRSRRNGAAGRTVTNGGVTHLLGKNDTAQELMSYDESAQRNHNPELLGAYLRGDDNAAAKIFGRNLEARQQMEGLGGMTGQTFEGLRAGDVDTRYQTAQALRQGGAFSNRRDIMEFMHQNGIDKNSPEGQALLGGRGFFGRLFNRGKSLADVRQQEAEMRATNEGRQSALDAGVSPENIDTGKIRTREHILDDIRHQTQARSQAAQGRADLNASRERQAQREMSAVRGDSKARTDAGSMTTPDGAPVPPSDEALMEERKRQWQEKMPGIREQAATNVENAANERQSQEQISDVKRQEELNAQVRGEAIAGHESGKTRRQRLAESGSSGLQQYGDENKDPLDDFADADAEQRREEMMAGKETVNPSGHRTPSDLSPADQERALLERARKKFMDMPH